MREFEILILWRFHNYLLVLDGISKIPHVQGLKSRRKKKNVHRWFHYVVGHIIWAALSVFSCARVCERNEGALFVHCRLESWLTFQYYHFVFSYRFCILNYFLLTFQSRTFVTGSQITLHGRQLNKHTHTNLCIALYLQYLQHSPDRKSVV